MKRYVIMVRELARDREVALYEVDSHPERVARALGRKLAGKKKKGVRIEGMYDTIRIVDNEARS
jgi:hypothetical protein